MAGLFRQFARDLRGMKHYLIVSALVFLAGCVLGATDRGLDQLLYSNAESLGEIVSRIQNSDNPQLSAFLFIFFNNAVKSILFVFFGAAFAIFPLFVLVFNGMMLGFLLLHPEQTASFWELLIKGILPHGIIELPAIILACAYGIRFGGLITKGLLSFASAERRAKSADAILHFLRMTLPLIIVLIVSLFVAAVIESTLTFHLMRSS